ncbi:hypothetical protein Tco_0628017 [Tanacetum coccineum]|uniref:Uncharacterized protein n=1 Tax=Tanacetum coccineum TaxID=301880 RepID=A0ABQ4WP61_9ASTR
MTTLWNLSIERSINILVPAFTSQPKTDKTLLGFGVRLDTLNPTIIKVSYPRGGQGSWYVSVFTLSSMDWNKLENDRLPRESIRFKRPSQAVVVHDIDAIFKDILTVPMCISSLGNSLIVSGSTDETEFYLFYGWSLLVDVTSVTSFTLLVSIPTPSYVNLLGFSNDEIPLPIVEVPSAHQLANYVEVFNRSSSSKPLDIDLNIPLFDEHVTHQWKKNTLTCVPTTPHAPILDLKTITTSKHGVKLAKHKIFDDKVACVYDIGFKCLTKGYEYKVVRSCPNRYAVECVHIECYWDVTRVYRPKDIINDLNIEYNFDVSFKRAWKAKQLALESNQGYPIASFAQLPYYSYNLKLANENMVTHINIDNEGRFKMLFIRFGVAQHKMPSIMTIT